MRRVLRVLFSVLALLSTAGAASADPYFEEKATPFGTQPCTSAGCWTNYLLVVDLNGDGALDVVFANADGFFNKGPQSQPLMVYLNDSAGNFTDASATMVGGHTGWVRQIAVGDVNGDGKLDMYVPDAHGGPDKLFINQGGNAMTDEAATRLPNVNSRAGAVRFGDIDGDGDLDLTVGDNWTNENTPIAHLYINDGTGKFTEKTTGIPTTKSGTQPVDFDLFDANGDFALDLLINMHSGTNSLWINDGKGNFTAAMFPTPGSGSQFHYGPVACDIDNDGDLDVIIDNTGGGYSEQILVNDGTGRFTDETSTRITGNGGADDNQVACIDVDNDGDMDLVIASLSGQERVFINDGTGKFALTTTPAFPTVSDSTLWFDFGDLDGDGRLDAVTGQGESGSFLNRVYLGAATAPVDTRAPRFRAVEKIATPVSTGAKPIVRFGLVDNATTDVGPRLKKAYVKVTTPSGTTEVPAKFIGGDLFRAELPAQTQAGINVSYEVCATDWKGNDGCAASKTYDVQIGPPSDGGADGSTSSGGSSGKSSGASSGTSSGSSSGDDGGGGGGCSCDVPTTRADALGAFALVTLAALVITRRRRISGRGHRVTSGTSAKAFDRGDGTAIAHVARMSAAVTTPPLDWIAPRPSLAGSSVAPEASPHSAR